MSEAETTNTTSLSRRAILTGIPASAIGIGALLPAAAIGIGALLPAAALAAETKVENQDTSYDESDNVVWLFGDDKLVGQDPQKLFPLTNAEFGKNYLPHVRMALVILTSERALILENMELSLKVMDDLEHVAEHLLLMTEWVCGARSRVASLKAAV